MKNINGGPLNNEDLKFPVDFTITYFGCRTPSAMQYVSKDIEPDGYASIDIDAQEDCTSFYFNVNQFRLKYITNYLIPLNVI